MWAGIVTAIRRVHQSIWCRLHHRHCPLFFYSTNWNSDFVQHLWSPTNEYYGHLFECLLICVWLLLFSPFYQHLFTQIICKCNLSSRLYHKHHFLITLIITICKRLCNIGHKTKAVIFKWLSSLFCTSQQQHIIRCNIRTRYSAIFPCVVWPTTQKKRISSD